MKLQYINIETKYPDVFHLLKIRPRYRELLRLPWWYNVNILYLNWNVKKALTENPPGPFCLEHARLLSGCYCDRKYIDEVRKYTGTEVKPDEEKRWIQAYLDTGLTLCDVGYSCEGILYIEKAIALEKRPGFKNQYILQLCCRLNSGTSFEKIKKLAETLVTDEPKNPVAKMALIKAYINAKRFDGAIADINKIMLESPSVFGFLMAELQFSLGDFKAASDAFDKYEINRRLLFWLPEYDYKKAAAYYYSGQYEKCRKQALKIRRRKKWDKFYNLERLENVVIKREKFIDEIIESDLPDKFCVDTEKIYHYAKAVGHIIWCYLLRWKYPIIIIIIIIIFLFLHWFTAREAVVKILEGVLV